MAMADGTRIMGQAEGYYLSVACQCLSHRRENVAHSNGVQASIRMKEGIIAPRNGRYLNDVRKIFGFLDFLPHLVTVPFTQPISTIVTF